MAMDIDGEMPGISTVKCRRGAALPRARFAATRIAWAAAG
jgi:hypothetical protein